jgi:hypothetical protein
MIADTLKVSKQLVSNWLSGYRTVSLDEWTQIQAVINKESGGAQFLEENKPMNSIRVDPPKLPATARANGEPKTLLQAKEQLENLRLEVTQLKAAAVASPGKPASVPASPKAKAQSPAGDPGADPTYPPTGTPGADRPNPTPMPSGPKAPTKALPVTADTPFKITEILKLENLDSLLLLLANPAHTPLQRSLIYEEVKQRRNLVAGRGPSLN